MKILYVVINFLILAGILFLFGRKTVLRLFRGRREAINRALDEAEAMEHAPAPVLEQPPLAGLPATEPERAAVERSLAQAKLDQLQESGARERREIYQHMIEKTKTQFLQIMKAAVEKTVSREPYLSRIRANEAELIDEILSMITLTSGDMAYLKHSNDVLYVTLTSAYPLDPALVQKVDEATTRLLDQVHGKTSLWVLEDRSLIGGLRLRIGDTVYDGTVEEELYHYGATISRAPVSSEEAAKEILAEFQSKIESYTPKIHIYQRGRVIQISDGICWMDGLADIMYGEVVEFDCGEKGMILDIQRDRIGCVVFGEYAHIESGSRVRRLGRIASVPVGEALLGRVVDAIGQPVDGEGYIEVTQTRPVEYPAPAILDRAPVETPLHTGIKAIDALVPIGRGQRELIIGDRQTGKTAIALDAIINQKGKNTVCIYVAIGQKETTIAGIKDKLTQHGAMDYTIIVAASASDSAATQYIAPFSGTAMAEHFMYAGKDVLIIYDDLSKHAVAYRELALLLHRPSGREAYPGDIFYLHSRLLERSAHLSEALGGGSITALPMIETLAGDISAYIPTNVISITDGQIFLESELFNEGQRPAINVGLSVSRVGGAAQTKLMKQMAASLRTKLAQYRELVDFTRLGTDVDEATKQTLNSGAHLMAALQQGQYRPLEDWKQALLLFAVSEGYADRVPLEEMEQFEAGLFPWFEDKFPALTDALKTGEKADKALLGSLREALGEYAGRD